MSEERSFVWLSELLEDPDLLKPPEPIAPRLVWANRITLLAAREKTGKSTLAGAAAAAISAGKPFLGEETSPANVLVVALEEHSSEFAQRMVRFGADPARIAIVSGRSGQDLINAIWAAAEEIKPALIVWDTLAAFANAISTKPIESGDAQSWTRILMEIVDVSRVYGASLILHHSNKRDGKYRDSTAIGGAVDVIMHMTGEGSEPRVLKAVGRFEIPEIRIDLREDGFELLETPQDLQDRIVRFVAKHPECSTRDLVDGIGGKTSDVLKARDVLLKEGRLGNRGTPASHAYVALR